MLAGMSQISVISKQVEEAPHYFDFTKNEFMADCPGMAKLPSDPFPNKKPEDVVRSEIVARKLVLHATLKGDGVIDLHPGSCVRVDGQDFAVTQATVHINTENEQESRAEVEAAKFLTKPEPLKVLAQLRKLMAGSE